MLVITRKTGETIQAGGITFTLRRIAGGKVSVGIDAPPELRILRGELLDRDEPKERAA